MVGRGASEQGPLFAEGGASTLKLVVLLALAIMLMLADRQRGLLDLLRERALRLTEPVYALAAWPGEAMQALRFAVRDRDALAAENAQLREALLQAQAETYRHRSEAAAGERALGLLDARSQRHVDAVLARIVDVDLDPFRHRLLLDRGRSNGVSRGDGLMDALGVVGQVSAAGPDTAFAILITDPAHALPVEVSRTGLKTIVYGTGDGEELKLPNLPLSVDLEVGDRLLSSAVGGRFPPGIPVADVTRVERPAGAAFAVAYARPVSVLGRNRELLVLRPQTLVGPPDPEPLQRGVAPLTPPPATEPATPPAAAADEATP